MKPTLTQEQEEITDLKGLTWSDSDYEKRNAWVEHITQVVNQLVQERKNI